MNKIIQYLDLRKWPAAKKGHFLFHIIIGIALMVIFILLQATTSKQVIINSWFDEYISWRYEIDNNKFILQNLLPGFMQDVLPDLKKSDTKKASEKIVFLRFDEEAVKILGRPDIMPRDKVADLVDIAYRGGAKIIVFDMVFSDPDYTPAPKKPLPGDSGVTDGLSRDKKLYDLLNEIKNDAGSQTKVLLPVETYADGTQKGSIYSLKGNSVVDNRKIFAVSPYSTRADDYKMRFWLPYDETKNDLGVPDDILWSIPITVLSVYYGKEQKLIELKDKILKGKEEGWEFDLPDRSKSFRFYRERDKDGNKIRDSKYRQYNRVQYVLEKNDMKEGKKSIDINHVGKWTQSDYHLNNKNIKFKDKIVIIGRDDPDCHDITSTPIGKMEGMYVHGNSIATVMGETQPHMTSVCMQILLDVLLIILTAYGYALLPPYLTKYFILFLTGIFVISSFVYFYLTNEFVYISGAFASIGAYDCFNKLERIISKGISVDSLLSAVKNKAQ